MKKCLTFFLFCFQTCLDCNQKLVQYVVSFQFGPSFQKPFPHPCLILLINHLPNSSKLNTILHQNPSISQPFLMHSNLPTHSLTFSKTKLISFIQIFTIWFSWSVSFPTFFTSKPDQFHSSHSHRNSLISASENEQFNLLPNFSCIFLVIIILSSSCRALGILMGPA